MDYRLQTPQTAVAETEARHRDMKNGETGPRPEERAGRIWGPALLGTEVGARMPRKVTGGWGSGRPQMNPWNPKV